MVNTCKFIEIVNYPPSYIFMYHVCQADNYTYSLLGYIMYFDKSTQKVVNTDQPSFRIFFFYLKS